MKVVFTIKAKASVKHIASYLQENNVDTFFIAKHLEGLKTGIINILTSFPESGNELELDGVLCRRLVVKNYNVLYSFDSSKLIRILLVYKRNIPNLH